MIETSETPEKWIFEALWQEIKRQLEEDWENFEAEANERPSRPRDSIVYQWKSSLQHDGDYQVRRCGYCTTIDRYITNCRLLLTVHYNLWKFPWQKQRIYDSHQLLSISSSTKPWTTNICVKFRADLNRRL